ncbi:MAG: aminoacetone oxidase family FAD-binding enzyme [Pseudomonadota bacterium]
MSTPDVLILGAGASGLACAVTAARRGRRVLVVDHQQRPGRKLLLTGGGRCNVTNREVTAAHYHSANRHFPRSALARFGPDAVLRCLSAARLPVEERDHGRLFLRGSAGDLLDLLLREARAAGVEFSLGTAVEGATRASDGTFTVATARGLLTAPRLVVATGGPAWPTSGATGIGHALARGFGLAVFLPRPALVPLVWSAEDRACYGALAGNHLEVTASTAGSPAFTDRMLFTHRGLSGPAILQVSTWWQPGQEVLLDLLPGPDPRPDLLAIRAERPRLTLRTALGWRLPRRLVATLPLPQDQPLAALSEGAIAAAIAALRAWAVRPAGTGGFGAAEATAGGVDTAELSSKTMEARRVPGLFFTGEVLDVTGWLGGYNLHWAWASGAAAGEAM